MAQRRMISLKVIDTDEFLDMPPTTQNLYFHFCMRADDDGFVSSPKKIMKIANSADDDLKVLISKQFIIPFQSGVCVIKHWRVHNLIRSDRYIETEYKDEKKMLIEKDNKYLLNTGCQNVIPNGNQMDAQGRLGKGRLGKVISASPTASAEKWDFSKKLKELQADKRQDLQAIGLYWSYKRFVFQNLTQYQSALRRELRAAKNLDGYEMRRIKQVMDWLKENTDFKWTLETCHKIIDEDLSALKPFKKSEAGNEDIIIPSYAKGWVK